MKYSKQLLLVTRWEFNRFFKPKNELIGIIIMLVISVASFFISRYLRAEGEEKIALTIIENTNERLIAHLSVGFEVDTLPLGEEEQFISQISSNQEGILLTAVEDAFTIHAYRHNNDIDQLKQILNGYRFEGTLREKGISPELYAQLHEPAQITESFVVTEDRRYRTILSYFFAILMIMAVFISFAFQFTAITGEKQSKITEQIVSAIKPQTWMDGKILGITLTGISSMLTYTIVTILGASLLFQFTGTPVVELLKYIHLPSFIIFFTFSMVGVLIWNSVMAAIASMITDPNNSYKSALMMLPVVFVVASFLVINNPDDSLAVFLSWFPLTSATAMPVRWAITELPWWNLVASMGLLLLTFYLLRKLAAKIFQVSILITGKEPTWREVLKQIRES